MVTVDLGEADCKEELIIKINGDNDSDEKCFETYSGVLNGIESKLKNKEWAKTFRLFTKDDNTSVDNLGKFITAVKQSLSQNNKASFCIKVGVCCIFLFVLLFFFLVFFWVFVFFSFVF